MRSIVSMALILSAALALGLPRDAGAADRTAPPRYDNTSPRTSSWTRPGAWRTPQTPDPAHDRPQGLRRRRHPPAPLDPLLGRDRRRLDRSSGTTTSATSRSATTPPKHDYWTYVTTVTGEPPLAAERHARSPRPTSATAPGQTIDLEVSIYYRDDMVQLHRDAPPARAASGSGPFPWPADWYGGDTHFHTMYTNNIAEFGAPLPAVRLTAAAIGLHWLAVDRSLLRSRRDRRRHPTPTPRTQWEYTLQSPSGTQTFYRDVFAYGSTWGGLGADIAESRSPELAPLPRGRDEPRLDRRRLLREDAPRPLLQPGLHRFAR